MHLAQACQALHGLFYWHCSHDWVRTRGCLCEFVEYLILPQLLSTLALMMKMLLLRCFQDRDGKQTFYDEGICLCVEFAGCPIHADSVCSCFCCHWCSCCCCSMLMSLLSSKRSLGASSHGPGDGWTTSLASHAGPKAHGHPSPERAHEGKVSVWTSQAGTTHGMGSPSQVIFPRGPHLR